MNNPYKDMKITCDFIQRFNPVNGIKEFHRGQDFVSKSGETFAGVHGTIRLCQEILDKKNKTWEFGKFYQISFIYKKVQFFCNIAHNKKFIAKEKDIVEPDTVIALQGSTGLSTGDHIHYEIFTYQKVMCNEIIKNVPTYLWNDGRLFLRPTTMFDIMGAV